MFEAMIFGIHVRFPGYNVTSWYLQVTGKRLHLGCWTSIAWSAPAKVLRLSIGTSKIFMAKLVMLNWDVILFEIRPDKIHISTLAIISTSFNRLMRDVNPGKFYIQNPSLQGIRWSKYQKFAPAIFHSKPCTQGCTWAGEKQLLKSI